MEEIDLTQLINYIKSKVIYILLVVSIAFCLSSLYVNKFRTPEYTSKTTVLINQISDTAISSSDVILNKSLVSTYGEIIKSKRVLRQVIDKLDLDYSYGELYNKVGVGEITDTSIISISVTDKNNILASDIANNIAEVFSKEIVDIYNIENVSIIDEAEVSDIPSTSSPTKIIIIVVLASFFMSTCVVFIIYYFDTTIKNEVDIEKATGLPVIGIVPAGNGKERKHSHSTYHEEVVESLVPLTSEKIVMPNEKKKENLKTKSKTNKNYRNNYKNH